MEMAKPKTELVTKDNSPLEGELIEKPGFNPEQYDPEFLETARRLAKLKTLRLEVPLGNDDKPLRGHELDAFIGRIRDSQAKNILSLGLALREKREELGSAAYKVFVAEIELPPTTEYNARRVADLLQGVTEANFPRVENLSVGKMIELSRLPAPVVDRLFEDGTLAKAEELSRQQIAEIARLEKANENKERTIQSLTDQLEARNQEDQKRSRTKRNKHLVELRRAVIDEVQALRANSESLERVMQEIDSLPEDIAHMEVHAISCHLMYGLQFLSATAQKLFHGAFDMFPDFYPDVGIPVPVLTREERDWAQSAYSVALRKLKVRAGHREVDSDHEVKEG